MQRTVPYLSILLALALVSACSSSSDGDADPGADDSKADAEDGSDGAAGSDGAGSRDDAQSSDDSDDADNAADGDGDDRDDVVTPGLSDDASDPIEVDVQTGECDLDSGWEGDDFCILPPPPDKGFQLRIGPEDYDNPDPRYILMPGEEATDDFSAVSGNDEPIFFYYRQFRMRPGAHHMIVSDRGASSSGGGFGAGLAGGRRIGTANISQDFPAGGEVAPENEGVGIEMQPKSSLNVSLHSINVTDEPIVREVWVNFWYVDPDDVTEGANQLFKIGDASFAVEPGADTILGPYNCNISGDQTGRMLWFYGHRHANNRRFSAWRVRDGERELFYEGFEWEDPLTLEYSSTVKNPVADRDNHVEGGWSGVLDLMPGDKLEWECHVVNEQDTTLRFTNETYLGEMCIMDGEMVGVTCDGI